MCYPVKSMSITNNVLLYLVFCLQLKLRLMERKTRNQDAAAMILGLGERQKTIVERTKKVMKLCHKSVLSIVMCMCNVM